jgi:hypothetical protein
MVAFNFPDNPFIGEAFAPPNGPAWQWDGLTWRIESIAPPITQAEVSVGDILPTVGSFNGQLWWQSNTGKLFVWFDDTSSQQWVQIIAPTLILDATDSLVKAKGGTVVRPLEDWFAGMGREDNPPEVGFWPDQATTNIWRMRDRVFIGDASDYDGNLTQANGSWLGESQELPDDGNIGQHWLESSAQLYSNHTQGGIAVLGATRVGDQSLMGHTAIGVAGFAYANKDPGNVWGGYFEGIRDSVSTNFIFGAEVTAKNLGETKTNNSYNVLVPGGTYGLWAAAGGQSIAEPVPTANSTAAIVIGDGLSRWIKGIVFKSDGLEGTDGLNAGKAIAIELGMNQAIKWRHAAEQYSTSGEIRSDNNLAAFETRIVFGPGGLLLKCMDGSQNEEVTIAEFPVNPAAGIYPSLQSGMAGIHLVATGTNDDGDVNLTPKGTGVVVTRGTIQMNSIMSPEAGGAVGTGLMLTNIPNFGVHYGSGIPLITAAQGSIYMRTDGTFNERIYINEDGTARWSALVDDITGKVDIAHVGAGGDAHALAVPIGDTTYPAGNPGFMSGADKAKLNTISAGVGATLNRFYNTPGSSVWIKPANIVALEVWIQAGGGGGGGAVAAVGQTSVGAGGAGGGGVRKFYDKAALTTLDPDGLGITVVVGAGGLAGSIAGSAGAAGSVSSFGTLSATGGAGGNTSGASALDAYVAGGAPGTGTGGDENITGGPGYHAAKAAGTTPYTGVGGVGGSAAFGNGGGYARTTNDTPGINGERGSGGSGGYSANGGGGSAGGTGGDGYVKLREYY